MLSLPSLKPPTEPTPANAQGANLRPVGTEEFLPPVNRWIVWSGIVLTGAIAASIGLTSVVKYNVTVKANAIVRPSGDLRFVQTEVEGSIKEILVKENQVVNEGEIIAKLDDSQLQIKKSQLQGNLQQLKLQQAQIDTQIQSLNNQIQAESRVADRTVTAAEAELARNQRDLKQQQVTTQTDWLTAQASLEKANVDLAKARTDLTFTQRDRDRYQKLAQQGAIAQREAEQKQQLVEQAQAVVNAEVRNVEISQAKLQAAESALNPSDASVTIAQERIAQEDGRGEAAIAGLNKEKQSLVQRKVEMEAQIQQQQKELQQFENQIDKSVIRANNAGVILKLNLRNVGQVVRSGDAIAEIAPNAAPLVIKANVASQDIQKVSQGQRVQLRIAACPYPDFGVLEGVVSNISPDAISPQTETAGSPTKLSSGVFAVEIQPKQTSLVSAARSCMIQAGMEAQADIISKEDTILRFLLRQARLMADL